MTSGNADETTTRIRLLAFALVRALWWACQDLNLGPHPLHACRVTEPFRRPATLGMYHECLPEFAKVSEARPEIEEGSNAFGRVVCEGNSQTGLQVLDPSIVCEGDPRRADVVERMGAYFVQTKVLGHLHRLLARPNRHVDLERGRMKPGKRAEHIGLGARRRCVGKKRECIVESSKGSFVITLTELEIAEHHLRFGRHLAVSLEKELIASLLECLDAPTLRME